MLLIIEQQQLEARVHGSHSDVPEVPAAAEGDSLISGALKTTTTSVCFRRLNLNNYIRLDRNSSGSSHHFLSKTQKATFLLYCCDKCLYRHNREFFIFYNLIYIYIYYNKLK